MLHDNELYIACTIIHEFQGDTSLKQNFRAAVNVTSKASVNAAVATSVRCRIFHTTPFNLVSLIGVVVCSLAAYCGSNCTLARSMDGRISTAAPLALAYQLPLLMIAKCGWSGFPVLLLLRLIEFLLSIL